MENNQKALNYIIDFIKRLNSNFLPSIQYESYVYLINICFNSNNYKIELSRSLIEDFEIALEKYKDTDYFYSLDSTIKFLIYIKLGSESLLDKDFLISREIINERRDWLKYYRVNSIFDEKITEILYEGLKNMSIFFDSLLKKGELLDLQEIKNHKKQVQHLIDYYNKEHNLNSIGVGIKNLEYLKAAAVTQILYFEYRKKTENMPTIWKAIDQKIYFIVTQLRKAPFLGIKLPKLISDLEVASW